MKLAEDVFHQNKGVKKIRIKEQRLQYGEGYPLDKWRQRTWTSIRWGKTREGSRKVTNKGDHRN